MELLDKNIQQINKLCQKYNVVRLFVFGSALTNRFSDKSDIDFLVDFENVLLEDYADNFFDFKYSLQDLLNRDIDLLESKALRNPYFKENIEKTKKLVYG